MVEYLLYYALQKRAYVSLKMVAAKLLPCK